MTSLEVSVTDEQHSGNSTNEREVSPEVREVLHMLRALEQRRDMAEAPAQDASDRK